MSTAIEIITRVIEQETEIVIERYLIDVMSNTEYATFDEILGQLILNCGWTVREEQYSLTLQPPRRKTVVSKIVEPKILGEKI